MSSEEIELRVKLQKQVVKEALKEALKEWMDEKFKSFGKWTLGAVAASLMVALAYAILTLNGWQAKH